MSEATVIIEQGELRGKICKDYNGRTFYSFQGIPYAKPPVGDLRFKAPEPPEKWEGTWDATVEREGCYSQHFLTLEECGSEDCLYLNVFTPEIQFPKTISNKLRPVMVLIPGGRFVRGSGTAFMFGPDFLVAQDVILVTFNYRTGCLGFLNLEDPTLEVPGNAALKDQILALRWVQKNISSFCGDPSRVTIFGESAGATSVHLMMLSPMAKGLFHGAIIQGGSALHYWSKETTNPVPKMATALGFEFTTEKDFLERLMKLPVEEIYKAQKKLAEPYPVYIVRPFAPVVERSSFLPKFLHDEPINVIRSGNYNHVPLMIGHTTLESLHEVMRLYNYQDKDTIKPNFDILIPCDLNIEKDTPEWENLIVRLKEFYFDKKRCGKSVLEKYSLMASDIVHIRRVHSIVKNHIRNSKCPIFFYVFSFDGKANFCKANFNIKIPGVCHADELSYIFKNKFASLIVPGSPEELTMKRTTTLWANFAKYGDPNPPVKDQLINVVWKPVVNETEIHYLEIGEELLTGVNPESDRMAFWDSIFAASPTTEYF